VETATHRRDYFIQTTCNVTARPTKHQPKSQLCNRQEVLRILALNNQPVCRSLTRTLTPEVGVAGNHSQSGSISVARTHPIPNPPHFIPAPEVREKHSLHSRPPAVLEIRWGISKFFRLAAQFRALLATATGRRDPVSTTHTPWRSGLCSRTYSSPLQKPNIVYRPVESTDDVDLTNLPLWASSTQTCATGHEHEARA
jgi:hypothetical protein